jgi:DNA-binding MarR family transcriptional regulator
MFSLFHAAHALEKRMEEAFEQVGLSLAKFGALSQLVNAGEPLSLSELAARCTCVRSNITQLVDRLEADGLVRRIKDPADRRSIRATVTTVGIERHAAGARQMEKVQAELTRMLAGVDRDVVARALRAIR